MTTNKNNFRSLLLVVAFVCAGLVSQAQSPDDPGDPSTDPDPQNVPFDGGLSLVVAAGVAYAAKKGYDKRKKAGNTSNS